MGFGLRKTAAFALVVLLFVACGDGDSGTAGGPPTTSTAWALSLDLINAPSSGGPWTEQPDDGNPVDTLPPVCGVALTDDVPQSLAHAGRMFFSGEPYPLTAESFPIARHSRDRFAAEEEAAAFIEIHRQALATCDDWSYDDGQIEVDYTVTALTVTLPADGIAFEVEEHSETGVLVNLTAMYHDADVVTVIYYTAFDEATLDVLEEMISLASSDD